MCACARGKVIGFVCRLLAQKSSDLDITTKEHPCKCNQTVNNGKNFTCVRFESHSKLTGTTNRVFSVGHAYQPHLKLSMCFLCMHTKLVQCWPEKVANKIMRATDLDTGTVL